MKRTGLSILAVCRVLLSVYLTSYGSQNAHASSKQKVFILLDGFNSSFSDNSHFNNISLALKNKYPNAIGYPYSYKGPGYDYLPIDTLNSIQENSNYLSAHMTSTLLQNYDVYLIGYSVGGAVAAYYAATAPNVHLVGAISFDSPVNGIDQNDPQATCYREIINGLIEIFGRQDVPIVGDLTPGNNIIQTMQQAGVHTPFLSISSRDDHFITTNDSHIASGENYSVSSGGSDCNAQHGNVLNDPNAINKMISWIDAHDSTESEENPNPNPVPNPTTPAPTSTPVTCAPTANGVTLFTDGGYGGSCHTFAVGEYADLSEFGLSQNVSSLKDPDGKYHITLFDQTGLTGTPGYFDADTSQLTGYWDNRARSLRVEEHGSGAPPCAPGSNQVTLYTDANYQGQCVVKDIGEYRNPEAIGLPNDSITSLKVGSGAKAQLCDNADINSPCEFFDKDDPDLANNSINTNTVSSVKVHGGQPTTGCAPNDNQVALFDGANYDGLCVIKEIGVYNDPGAINLPNDSISSLKVGSRVKIRACDNAGMNSPCEFFENNDDNLANNSINTNTISSVEVFSRGGIELCDGTNYGGPCKLFAVGKHNLQDHGFRDVTESVRYLDGYGGLYHIVLWSEDNQTGNPAHYDNSVAAIDANMRNHVRSIEIYKHGPPNTGLDSPANGTTLPSTTTAVDLKTNNGGSEYVFHIWGNNLDQTSNWQGNTYHVNGLTPGTYSWQAKSRNQFGEGPWTSIWSFTIDAPPPAPTPTPTPSPTPPPTSTPTNEVELLTSPWHLEGNNGADQGDQDIDGNVLMGKDTLKVTFDLHGKTFGGGDDEASVVFDQSNDWRAANVIPYGQNGKNGPQTVTIPLSAFHKVGNASVKLDLSQPVGDLHARFWNSSQFVVDVTSVKVYKNSGGATPTPTPTATPSPTPTATPTPSPTPVPTTGTELLTSPWHLEGNDGASEKYQSVNPNVLQGKNTIRITYNLHGLQALGGDASAIIIDQDGWRFISLSDYGQNGLDGQQTVEIPLSDFPDLDLSQPIDGTIHTRFWYGSEFTVDITSIVVFHKD